MKRACFILSFLLSCLANSAAQIHDEPDLKPRTMYTAAGTPESSPQTRVKLDSLGQTGSKKEYQRVEKEAIQINDGRKVENLLNSMNMQGDLYDDGQGHLLYKEEAVKKLNEDRLKAYIMSLPKDGDFYVVEGDILLRKDEIARYLSLTYRFSNYYKPGEISFNIFNGESDFYRAPRDRNLKYYIDKSSFSDTQYRLISERMKHAGTDWEDACLNCGIKFTEVKDEASSGSSTEANFIVRLHDSGGVYLASSFLPHTDQSQRFLNIDPSYFNLGPSADTVGILRHQLGHILGYRHIQPPPVTKEAIGCYKEGNKWLSLSAFKQMSVMQSYCPGNVDGLRLDISANDKTAHRKLYGLGLLAGESAAGSANQLIVRFQGGNVPDNIAAILRLLKNLDLIKLVNYKVTGTGETLQSIYQKKLQLPLYSPAIEQLASEINTGRLTSANLEIGQEVFYPEVSFNSYDHNIYLSLNSETDKERLKDIEKNWPKNIYEKRMMSEDQLVTLTVTAFQLRLAVASEAKVKEAIEQIVKLLRTSDIRGVLVYSPNLADEPQYFARTVADNKDAVKSASGDTNGIRRENSPQSVGNDSNNVLNIHDFMEGVKPDKGLKKGNEGGLNFVFEISGAEKFYDSVTSCYGLECPVAVLLVDQVVEPHPDIDDSIQGIETAGGKRSFNSSGDAFTENNGLQAVRIIPDLKLNLERLKEHGTYMAGIIASKRNGYGIVGISPGVPIISFDWSYFYQKNEQHEQLFIKLVQDRKSAADFEDKLTPILVFATNYSSTVFRREERSLTDQWAKDIKDSRVLVIAAAGQPAPEEVDQKGKPLDFNFDKGPMNLGDLENVIVVTACEDCYGKSANIPDYANVAKDDSPYMVHIAAPSKDILSTFKMMDSNGYQQYVQSSGTSPATALVAGVVSDMYINWPTFFKNNPALLKTRIQVTSRPIFFQNESYQTKFAAGAVDPILALKDPRKNWIRGSGVDYVVMGTFKWNSEKLKYIKYQKLNPNGDGVKEKEIDTKDIYRIYRYDSQYLGLGNQDLWMIYVQERDDNDKAIAGRIRKIGPVKFKDKVLKSILLYPDDNTFKAKVLNNDDNLKDEPGIKLSEIKDLILRGPVEDVMQVTAGSAEQ